MKKTKLLYFVSEDWYFCSHRLSLAVAAKNAGYDVIVVTRVNNDGARILQAGLRLIPLNMSRRGMSPFEEFAVIWNLFLICQKERPDIVHHVAIKPVLYGTIAALFFKVCIINALAGMGWLFTSETWRARAMRKLVLVFFRILLPKTTVIVQNKDDERFVQGLGCRQVHMIRGAGVDVDAIRPSPEPSGPCVVLLVGRMLRDKGVEEYVAAAQILKSRGRIVRMLLVGAPDDQNPASIPINRLEQWKASGVIEWLGHRDDVPELLAKSHIVCLPSYREGVPKSLLEGLSAGRPLVATDVPGCREVVQDGINGLLVPVKDSFSLANALDKLILSSELRHKMGKASRDFAVTEFSSQRIEGETLNLYFQLTENINIQQKDCR